MVLIFWSLALVVALPHVYNWLDGHMSEFFEKRNAKKRADIKAN